MKTKITILIAVATIVLAYSTFGQNLEIKKTYYDIYNTKLKAEWQQTANGYINGYYKEYHQNGKLYKDKIVKTQDVYPYWGIDLKWKEFDQAGNLKWSISQNDKREFQGEQICYIYNGTKLVVSTRAVFANGNLVSFEDFRKNGSKSIDLNTKSFYRRYDENGKILDDIKIGPNGEFTGKLYQDGNEIIVEVLNGKIQKVYETNPKPENGNWQVSRLQNDTLLSKRSEGDTYFKKYYIDTVNVALIAKPNINIDYTQYENNTFGLDFVDPKFLCCALSQKYFYDIRFYDRGLQTFIREEIRDIKTDRLISLITTEKQIDFHENGKIKKVFIDEENWEEFDEIGNLINSYEMLKKHKYDNNYKFILEQKREYLRNSYGWTKYAIDLTEYRKDKPGYIYNEKKTYFNNLNDVYLEAFKVKNSSILLFEKEADELKNLLNSRDVFLNKILLDGQDNARDLFEVGIEGNKRYQVTIKEEFKNIYAAYVICLNKLNDSLTAVTFLIEPDQILSPKWKKVTELDLKKDKEIIEELLKGENLHETFDFKYIPDAWNKYNDTYLIWLKAYRNLIEEFDKAIKINGSKVNKKLKEKTNYNEIISILKSISN